MTTSFFPYFPGNSSMSYDQIKQSCPGIAYQWLVLFPKQAPGFSFERLIGRTPNASRLPSGSGLREASGVRASSAPLSQGRLRFDDRAGPRKGSSTLRPCIGTLNPPLSTPKKGTESAAVDHPLYSFAEQPKENGQKCADKQASDDREMKTEVSLAVMNIA